jgi:hypothetical protein
MSELLLSLARVLRIAQRVIAAGPLDFEGAQAMAHTVETDTPGVVLAEIEYAFYLAGLWVRHHT